MGNNQISGYRGDDDSWPFTVEDGSGDRVNITGAEVYFTVRKSEVAPIEFQLANDLAGGTQNEIEITSGDGVTGLGYVHVSGANTTGMDASAYIFDMQVRIDNNTSTIMKDNYILSGDVTY